MKCKLLFLSTILILFAGIVFGQVPQTISYQGILTDANGKTVPDGNYNLAFKLYDAASGGSALWTENQSAAVAHGIFNVILGSVNPLTLPFDIQYWLGVTVEGGTELLPRIQLTSSPYSFISVSAESIADQTVTTNKIVDGAVTASKILTGQVVKSINSLKDDVLLAAGSNISITPNGNTLTISSAGDTGGGDITAVLAGTGLTGGGTVGDVTLALKVPLGIIDAFNVVDSSLITVINEGTGDGVKGYSKEGDGIVGMTSSNTNSGVYGQNANGNFGYIGSVKYGVYGKSVGSNVFGIGTGVFGSADGLLSEGVRGENSNSGNFGSLGLASQGVYGKDQTSRNFGYIGSTDYGVYGENGTFGNFGFFGSSSYGVYGKHFTSDNYGYLGSNSEGVFGYSSAQYGLWGESTTGIGVYGKSTGSYAIEGVSTNSVGVYGASTNDWGIGGTNLTGQTAGFIGGTNTAFYCHNNNSGGLAIHAVTNGGTAASLQGNVTVSGTLYKGGGAFKIDHPLDPANKYLYHSFVESPDMMNVYNGNISLDANGEAIVKLPDWFEALNKDFRYQLTCIGGFAPVYIANEISGNQFKIAGGTAGMKVSWQVTGIRHDKFAEAHRIPIEEYKEGKQLGKYIHPLENGMAESLGINYEENQSIFQEQKRMKEQNEKIKAEAEKNYIRSVK